jgi:8-oxo-dGTP pyrophosphatase MutT (NUDIX family)
MCINKPDIHLLYYKSENKYENKLVSRNNTNRKEYYDDDVLVIELNDKVFKYPPKAGIIIFNKDFGKVILIKSNVYENESNDIRLEPKWGFPKGHKEKYETFEECAIRECYEETGILFELFHNHPSILINNTRYYICNTDTNTDKYPKLKPLDNKEILFCEFINILQIDRSQINTDTRIILKSNLELCKRISITV